MNEDMKLTPAKIEEMVEVAREQTADLIGVLLREAIGDFETSDSEGFKLTLTIEGERKGRGAVLTIQTKGQTAVELKRKDSTAVRVIDWGPTLFDNLDGDGKNAGDFPDAGDDEPAHQVRLLRPAPELLPAPAEVVEAEAEIVEEPKDGQDGQGGKDWAKVRKITISNTGISDWALEENPEWYRKLTTVRKTGFAKEGEVVRIIIRNPDDGHKFDMGLYKCTDAVPAYDDPADGRSSYTFTRLEDEDGPVNGGGDIPGDE